MQSDNVERSEFESPSSYGHISDEEEQKIAPAIPLIKTNTKEGRMNKNEATIK